MRRLIAVVITFCLIISNGIFIFADNQAKSSPQQKKIMVYMKPDLTVEVNGTKQKFFDVKGTIVYPIIYKGSTYLPVRAMSVLMQEPIEWDGASKTIFIGRTLSQPNKIISETTTDSAIDTNRASSSRQNNSKMVIAYLKPDVIVMYDFVLQTFTDVNGGQVYPIICDGTAYLPIRAISELMGEPIQWEGDTKTIIIGDGVDMQPDPVNEEEPISALAKKLKNYFEQEEVLYYEATAKTTNLKEASSIEDKKLIAKMVSENYTSAQQLSIIIKNMDSTELKSDEAIAHEKLTAFAESTEYYILVLENITYLAAEDADYSMLAETFLYFAMDSQTKMEEARAMIQDLNQ